MLILTAVLTTGALTLTACGSRDDDKGSESGGTQTVVIGLDAPLTGDLSALGLGIKNSADLAVKTANKDKTVPGITFELQPLDDQAQPSVGGQNAQKFIGNKDLVGVVGPLNSSVAQSMQKPFEDASLTQVSPANTGTELTQGDNWKDGDSAKKRPFKTYFRTATTDAIQGAFAANYLFKNAKIKDVYLIDDQKTYGAGLAASFKTTFTGLGGKIVGADHVNPDDRDFNSVVTKVKSSGAKAVYYGGEYPAGAPLSQQLKDSVNIPLMGGDGMYSADFISLNKKAQGDIATSVGKPVEELESAKKFIADYQTAGYKDAYEAYGGSTYDATWAIIEAVKIVAAANDGKLPDDSRAKVLEAMAKVQFEGVTGPVAFDEYGDTTNTMMTAYQVDGGKWVSKLSEAVAK
ncbi:branched-chain amino acid ABC transporter substrate-binding protein [Streptomyces sp. NBC_01218]|uniref:branched-chain amino acid ABC transporter substrate-binding protein n=1 Tax=unclassified Streptomyces TaxID=2593676 RepID=UPI0023B9DD77|nr:MULTISPECIES: branched-chain amino acid ABC transporter substrate-binding protein [unclassified Streptomyces]WEH43849.1 branched-chain amino acid ABC transporter substrate-binding protein [Streptomyces sp. AM 2-1-1]WSQ55511.1 branched-chain amino acid ABC transporter substrate-binding protein [Streptomyces sp. NBC_01218]